MNRKLYYYFLEEIQMDSMRAEVAKFLAGLLTTILGLFGKDVDLTEEQLAGIQKFVDTIFFA